MTAKTFVLLGLTGVVILLGSFASHKDDGKAKAIEEIKKINAFYEGCKEYSMDVSHHIYVNYTTKTPSESYNGFFRKAGNKEHSLLLNIETIQDDDARVVIDTVIKKVIITKISEQKMVPQDLTSMQQFFSSCIINKLQNGDMSLNIKLKKDIQEFSALTLEYSKEYVLKKLILYHKDKLILYEGQYQEQEPRTEITFSNFSRSKVRTSDFSYSHVLSKQKEAFKLKSNYKNFQLVVLL